MVGDIWLNVGLNRKSGKGVHAMNEFILEINGKVIGHETKLHDHETTCNLLCTVRTQDSKA